MFSLNFNYEELFWHCARSAYSGFRKMLSATHWLLPSGVLSKFKKIDTNKIVDDIRIEKSFYLPVSELEEQIAKIEDSKIKEGWCAEIVRDIGIPLVFASITATYQILITRPDPTSVPPKCLIAGACGYIVGTVVSVFIKHWEENSYKKDLTRIIEENKNEYSESDDAEYLTLPEQTERTTLRRKYSVDEKKPEGNKPVIFDWDKFRQQFNNYTLE